MYGCHCKIGARIQAGVENEARSRHQNSVGGASVVGSVRAGDGRRR